MAHPTDEELERYRARTLPRVKATKLEAHLDGCEDCRQLVSALLDDGPADSSTLATDVGAEAPAIHARELLAGDVIDGRYRLIRVIGRGSMGMVFEAHHEALNQRVALKFIDGPLADTPHIQQRFIREGRTASRLHGPHVCRVLDLGSHHGLAFLVLELLTGETLEAKLERKAPLRFEDAMAWVAAACTGLEEAHALGVVHRDVKPANLFLARVGNVDVLKVLDFGIARTVNVEIDEGLRLTSALTFVGTPAYMSPEQFTRRHDQLSAATDIWALGVVLYQLVTGRLPFRGKNTEEMGEAVLTSKPVPVRLLAPLAPKKLSDVIERCLEKDATKRFESAAALRAALEGVSTSAGWTPRELVLLSLVLGLIVVGALVWLGSGR